MSHTDPTVLSLAALGEPIDPVDRGHLESCPVCAAEVDDLTALVTLGREAPESLPRVPGRVWAGISEELGLAGAPDGTDEDRRSGGGAPVGHDPTVVVPMGPRRRGLYAVAAAAASVGAILGGSVVWAALGDTTPDDTGGTLVAQAVLAPLSTAVNSSGSATVLDSPDGQVIRVDARGLPQGSGFYEVWLIDEGVTKLVALGALPSGSVGTFTIPPGVSVADFPVVDVSLEPYDGDPGHSHDSLMRGVLEA